LKKEKIGIFSKGCAMLLAIRVFDGRDVDPAGDGDRDATINGEGF